MAVSLLSSRALLTVSGADAFSFLQSLVTNDLRKLPVYACLLSPQGRFLHDLFISQQGDAFLVECEASRRDDLLKRFSIYKLRAKVTIEPNDLHVYVTSEAKGFKDPRHPDLPYRFYAPAMAAENDTAYKDLRISLGIGEGADFKPEGDTLADINLDYLAVSWDKGCYVGQEVTARVEYRGLVKRRMMIVEGEMGGDVRTVDSSGKRGLTVVRLDEATPQMRLPAWVS